MLKDQIKDIVLSTWSHDYYKEGHTFTEDGVDLDKAVDQLLQTIFERIKERVGELEIPQNLNFVPLKQKGWIQGFNQAKDTILEELGKEAGVV